MPEARNRWSALASKALASACIPTTKRSANWKFTPAETAKAPPRSRSPRPTTVVSPLVFDKEEDVDGEENVDDVDVIVLNGNNPENDDEVFVELAPELAVEKAPELAARLGCAPTDEIVGAIMPIPAPM